VIIRFKKTLTFLLLGALVTGCAPQQPVVNDDEIIREKALQLVQAERNNFTSSNTTSYNLGSVLSGGGSRPANDSVNSWKSMVEAYQNSSTIPVIYGIDAVHGQSISKQFYHSSNLWY